MGRSALLALPAVALVVGLLALPLAEVLGLAASDEGPIHAGFARSRLLASLGIASASTLVTLALGLPVAWVLARFEFPGRGLLTATLTVPFVLPGLVAVLAALAWVGPRGILGSAFGGLPPFAMVLFVHAFFNQALVVRLVSAAWASIDPRLAEAARSLGATPARAALRVELPLVLPAVGAAALLVFLFSFTSFAPVLVLGGPTYATLEVGIFQEMRAGYWRSAAALSAIQLAVTVLAALAYVTLSRRVAAPFDPASQAAGRRPVSRRTAPAVALAAIVAIFVVLGPLAALVAGAFSGSAGGFTIEHFAALADLGYGTFLHVTPLEAATNSLRVALLATAIALPAGALAAVALAGSGSRAADALLTAPLGASAVTLGVGYLLLFDAPPFDLRATVLLVVLAHALIATPFVLRVVLATAWTIPARFAESARVLGSGPARAFFRVELPLLAPALAVAAAFALAMSLGEFAAASVLVRPEDTTLPLLLHRVLSRPGRLGEAFALGTVLSAFSLSVFVAVERMRPRSSGGF